MKVALVHDWLTGMRGGEKCLEAFLFLYPNADIFTLVHRPGTTTLEIDARVKAQSFLGRLPGIARYYRALLPLFPLAARSLDPTGYDLIISLSHAAAKDVRIPAGARHVCYCFTPMRYIWDQVPHYFPGWRGRALAPLIGLLRLWDRRGARRVDHFVAISSFVAARIRRFYGRRSDVIAPPVRMSGEVPRAALPSDAELVARLPASFFLCAGALVPYKRIDVAVEAFRSLDQTLVVAGGGPELDKLRRDAPPNVVFLGAVSDFVLWECYRRARALVFPGIEDFGIVPVECLASGHPVIGVGAGGLRDTVNGHPMWIKSNLVASGACGVFISKREYGKPSALAQAVHTFCRLEQSFDSADAVTQAVRFSYPQFFRAWASFASRVGLGSDHQATFSRPVDSRDACSAAMLAKSEGASC